MYKKTTSHQFTFFDFNQSCGMQLDENNEWIKLSEVLQWDQYEMLYAEMFPSIKGNPAKPLRMALGALIIQKKKNLSDRALIKEIAENPYLQYFIGVTSFSKVCPFSATSLVYFRKRLDVNLLQEINDLYLNDAQPTSEHLGEDKSLEQISDEESTNIGTFILDATCSPSNIKYPQDYVLLNDAREKTEEMIDSFHKKYHPWKKPRTYRRVARKDYTAFAKTKKRTKKMIRSLLRKQLECLRRNLGYLEEYMSAGYALESKFINYYLTILDVYKQQKYMFDNQTHRVSDRIVSISQPYIRPIVRGKVKAPVEFGAKYDVSIDEKGHARLEKIQFEPYNESTVFIDAIEAYRARTGKYPERALVDKIYRTRENLRFCKNHGIRMSGPRLGRPSNKASTHEEYQDNTDRIEIERFFSLEKRCYGAGLIMTKLASTTLASIALSVFVANLFAIPIGNIFLLYFMESEDGADSYHHMEFFDVA